MVRVRVRVRLGLGLYNFRTIESSDYRTRNDMNTSRGERVLKQTFDRFNEHLLFRKTVVFSVCHQCGAAHE